MAPDRHFDSEEDLRRYEALLSLADVMVRRDALPELFRELATRLHDVVPFDIASFSLHDPQKDVMRLYVVKGTAAEAPLEVPVDRSPAGWVWQHQRSLVLPDEQAGTGFQRFLRILEGRGVRSYVVLPLTTAKNRWGALGLGSSRRSAYGEKDLRFLRSVVELVALALENAIGRAALKEERERLDVLLQISTKLTSSPDIQNAFPTVSDSLRRLFRCDHASVTLYDASTRHLYKYAQDSRLPGLSSNGARISDLRSSAAGHAFLDGEIKIYTREDLYAIGSAYLARMLEEGIRCLCCIPLTSQNGVLGTLNLASIEENAFMPADIIFLKEVGVQFAIDREKAHQEVAQLTDRLKKEKLYLEEEIRATLSFEEIVGESPVLKRVLSQVNTVAPSDTTVLILGETGTGKELVARAIHRMSARGHASFVKLNCAAIPTGLLESELFGHEKGAFTGAISQKIGRLELADGGTIFLDEVGDIPLELQPKLLRVLQDHEFERLGATRTIKVNLRLVAATNRDLQKGVAAGEFRSDLYYRLHVFPVRMPALRERGEDIAVLVRYFVQKFARSMNKQIEQIPAEAMLALKRWHWPGNVRELENFIERSVILTEGTTLNVPLSELRAVSETGSHSVTLEKLERDHILRVLRETGGVLAGVHGAAARLGMKRTTLQSRMLKMGITRTDYQN